MPLAVFESNASFAEEIGRAAPGVRQAWLDSLSDNELAEIEYNWRFWARPKQLAPDGDWLTWLLQTGRGFGKTRAGAGWVQERAVGHPRWCALVAKTPADARDVMVEGPAGILRNCPPSQCPSYEPSKRRLTWPNGSWGTIYSAEDADQLRGFSGDTAWLDEFGKYPNPREVWDNLQFGMREVSSDQPRVCITTTPRPLPILEEIERKASTVLVQGSSYENRANLAPSWFSETLSAYEGTRLGRQEIHGERLSEVEGRVYSSFSSLPYPQGNVDDSVVDTGGELYVGQDFNVNPMASVVAVRVVDECHVIDSLELWTSNTEEVAQEIRRRYPNRPIIFCPDPAGRQRHTNAPVGQTDFTILSAYGFGIHAPATHPAVVDRVNNAQAMFYRGAATVNGVTLTERRRVRIHSRAQSLIAGLKNLTYKEGTSIRDKASGFDHVCFAVDTPIETLRGAVPIQHVCAGDLVLTRVGYVPVEVSTMTDAAAETWSVQLETGASVIVTPDHPFWVDGLGFVPLRRLTRSDTLCTLSPCESTSAFGLRHTGRSRPDTISIIGTATDATTRSITSSVSQVDATSVTIGQRMMGDDSPSSRRISSMRVRSRLSGTDLLRDGHGIASTHSASVVNRSRSSVRGAVSRWSSSSYAATDTSARSAVSRLTGAHIVAVRRNGTAPVYNLRVAGPHEYFAAGVLVSNCDALDYLLWSEFNVLASNRASTHLVYL